MLVFGADATLSPAERGIASNCRARRIAIRGTTRIITGRLWQELSGGSTA
jgi:hypothetical protein